MKEVYKDEAPNNKVPLSQASEDKYYGLQISEGKHPLVKVNSVYSFLSFRQIVRGSLLHGHYDIKEEINFFLRKGNSVFEFDTPEELLEWLGTDWQ